MGSERYTDSDGNECDLPTMCRREPGWAANRIAALRDQIRRVEGEREGPGPLSSDGVCPFCNCYADTPHTWRDCARDLRERTQGLQERTDRLERDYAAANSKLREVLAAFRLKVSEALGCTKTVHGVTREPFTVAASDDVALAAIRGLRERTTWRPMAEAPRDGTEVALLFAREETVTFGVLSTWPRVRAAFFTGSDWSLPYYANNPPIGWAPLPAPPATVPLSTKEETP